MSRGKFGAFTAQARQGKQKRNEKMNSQLTVRYFVCAAIMLCANCVMLIEGHHEGKDNSNVRTWTFSDTGSHIHASYVASSDGKVQVRRSDGQVQSLEIARLAAFDQKWVKDKADEIRKLNATQSKTALIPKLVATKAERKPAIADSFEPFSKLKQLSYRQDAKYFYVESNSMPDHRMMVGITAWQQQVPLPQPYFGDNAWRIPLEPVVAENPLSAKSHFFRGAIALAANGIPIFNPIKNDGKTDTLIAGELDEFGGHCGRADDYHYHIAPTHLQEIIGKDKRSLMRSMATQSTDTPNPMDRKRKGLMRSTDIALRNLVTTITRQRPILTSTAAFMARSLSEADKLIRSHKLRACVKRYRHSAVRP